ncbi:MAG TPA: LamG domain-containing protein [Bacteroidales bacterium]|nr:LamG domain-containing protein [Bacteroidales bacterium]
MTKIEISIRYVFIMSLCFLVFAGFSQKADIPVMWLSFDEINVNNKLHVRTVEDQITNRLDTIRGTYVLLKDGVHGKSLLLDGYSAFLSCRNTPVLSGSFTVEGWLAMGAYPTNFCPLAEQNMLSGKGFSLGINSLGKPGFKIATRNGWIQIDGSETIPLLRWAHLAGIYDGIYITLYVNGKQIARKKVNSAFIPANNEVLLSGITSQKIRPEGTIRQIGTEPVQHFFDGLIDELKIWNKALTEDDFESVRKEISNIKAPDLGKRPLPTLPALHKFGAVYASLKFYESWDNFWRVSGLPDVVVSFDQIDGHFVFWRGTSYIPHWVTENGIWFDDEFIETWNEKGCQEPMSDKRCEHSQVEIIENTPARCMVHWRYAPIDNWYTMAHVDSVTGWGDWVDEIYTIYPDGVAVRSQTLHSSNTLSRHEWHEAIIVMGQGQRPEDVLYPDAVIMANMYGKEQTYSWEVVAPDAKKEGTTYVINKKERWLSELPDANIQLINTRSLYKPFTIINSDDEPKWDFYRGEFRRDISMFPWWNHWPTATKPSDGRYAMDSDRASHSSLSHVWEWKAYKETEFSETRLMLVGLTKEKASGLVSLTQSWSHAPKMSVKGLGISAIGYEPAEKAYQLECTKPEGCNNFSIRLECSPKYPAVNPAFVISNWDKTELKISINGKKVSDKKMFRYGLSNTANGSTLILWINKEFDNPLTLEVSGK